MQIYIDQVAGDVYELSPDGSGRFPDGTVIELPNGKVFVAMNGSLVRANDVGDVAT